MFASGLLRRKLLAMTDVYKLKILCVSVVSVRKNLKGLDCCVTLNRDDWEIGNSNKPRKWTASEMFVEADLSHREGGRP